MTTDVPVFFGLITRKAAMAPADLVDSGSPGLHGHKHEAITQSSAKTK